MNTKDVLHYGHLTLLKTIDGFPADQWETGGVCGVWSVKDIMAHLASYETALVDIFNSLSNNEPTPTLDRMMADYGGFNDLEVDARKSNSIDEVLAEYHASHEKVMNLAAAFPAEKFTQNGLLVWYGEAYDFDDFLVYTFYAHKREHAAQIMVLRDKVG